MDEKKETQETQTGLQSQTATAQASQTVGNNQASQTQTVGEGTDETAKREAELLKRKELLEQEEEIFRREEELKARKSLGGNSLGAAPPKEKLSDLEYSKAVERGEANPFEDDGIK